MKEENKKKCKRVIDHVLNSVEKPHLNFPFKSMDSFYYASVYSNDLFVFAAQPNIDIKSFIALLIKNNLKKKSILFLSLKESEESFLNHYVYSASQGNLDGMREQILSHKDWVELSNILEEFKNGKCRIDDQAKLNIKAISELVENKHKEAPINFLVINDLQMISGINEGSLSRDQEVEEIMRNLKTLAKKMNIIIILFASTTKQAINESPQYQHIKDSISVIGIADHLMIIESDEANAYHDNDLAEYRFWSLKSHRTHAKAYVESAKYDFKRKRLSVE